MKTDNNSRKTNKEKKGSLKAMRDFGAKIIFLTLLILPFSLLSASDFHLRPKGFVSIPRGDGNLAVDGNERYGMGGGGEVGLELDLSTVWPNPIGLGYTLGVEGGMQINPMQNDDEKNIQYYSAGGVASLYFFPMSRLFLRVDGAVGAYSSIVDEQRSGLGLFWRWGGELGFRFTPGFILSANAGWRQFEDGDIVLNSGMYAGLTMQLTFQTGSRAGQEGVRATLDQYGAVFPAFMQAYQSNSIGSVTLRNYESAEIRNVRLFFRADGYTTSEFPCGSVSVLPRGRSVQMPLHADFSSEILSFTDSGRVIGELVIRYTFLGKQQETVQAISIATHSRNMVTIEDEAVDPAAFASFISPTSPDSLSFARSISELARANSRTGHNNNMLYAVWLLEGLKAAGIRIGQTYTNSSEVQFPAETLLYRTGSNRDIALLFASALEGVGIPSAFIQTENDFLVAVGLGVDQNAAETLFNGTGRILIVDEQVWLPLSMSSLGSGFMACWTQAVNVLNRTFAEDSQADFVIVRDAWATYPPALMPTLERSPTRTNNAQALAEFNRFVQAYITQEINPIINRQTNVNTAVGQNRLGILLVRAGRIAEGKTAYERAAGMGSVPAMTNRGNLALIEREFALAERWFRQALQAEPENRAALRGIERVQSMR